MTVADVAELIAELSLEDPFTPGPPSEAAAQWSEAAVREWFASGGATAPAVGKKREAAQVLSRAEILEAYPPPSKEDFTAWYPGLARSKTECPNPRLRLLCFTNAGNEENVYTNEGIGARRVPTLLDWCRANNCEVFAPQLPGRGARSKEPFTASVQEAAREVVRVSASRLLSDGVPFCVIGHSLGTWLAFEVASLLREKGLPQPRAAFLSAFPAPDIPEGDRPWKKQCDLDDDGFKDECRGWDVNEVLLKDAGMWAQYAPLMRADFRLFDEFAFARAGEAPLSMPACCFVAEKDKKVKEAHVSEWKRFFEGPFELSRIEGHHLFVMASNGLNEQKKPKIDWLEHIVKRLPQYLAA